jgi:transcriptional regulator with XRE-family HTH domain
VEDTVGSRVKLARTKRGLGQGAVCKAVGVSSGYLSLLERSSPDVKGSVKNPRSDTLQALAYVLDVPTSWLAYGTDPEPDWDAPFKLRSWPPDPNAEVEVPVESERQRVATPAEAPAPKRLSSRPPPPADAFDEESTTVRDAEPVRHVPPVKFSDREKVETDPDPRAGEVLARTPKPLTALDVPVPERVTVLDEEDRTPTPSPR